MGFGELSTIAAQGETDLLITATGHSSDRRSIAKEKGVEWLRFPCPVNVSKKIPLA